MKKTYGKRFWSILIITIFLLNSVPYPAYGMRMLIPELSSPDENISEKDKKFIAQLVYSKVMSAKSDESSNEFSNSRIVNRIRRNAIFQKSDFSISAKESHGKDCFILKNAGNPFVAIIHYPTFQKTISMNFWEFENYEHRIKQIQANLSYNKVLADRINDYSDISTIDTINILALLGFSKVITVKKNLRKLGMPKWEGGKGYLDKGLINDLVIFAQQGGFRPIREVDGGLTVDMAKEAALKSILAKFDIYDNIATIDDVTKNFGEEWWHGEVVPTRLDGNIGATVPRNIKEKGDKIREMAPTTKTLSELGAKVVILDHSSRREKMYKEWDKTPEDGEIDPKYSTKPLASVISELIGKPVKYVPASKGPLVEEAIGNMQPGDVIILENLRFWEGETAKDEKIALRDKYAEELYTPFNKKYDAKVIVNGAFQAGHRGGEKKGNASFYGMHSFDMRVTDSFTKGELKKISSFVRNIRFPYWYIAMGDKIDKIDEIEKLIQKGGINGIIWAGKIAEEARKNKELLKLAKEHNVDMVFPLDYKWVEELPDKNKPEQKVDYEIISAEDFGKSKYKQGYVVDIGKDTPAHFGKVLREEGVRTIFANGVAGMSEIRDLATGSIGIAQAVKKLGLPKESVLFSGGSASGIADEVGLEATKCSGGGVVIRLLSGEELFAISALNTTAEIERFAKSSSDQLPTISEQLEEIYEKEGADRDDYYVSPIVVVDSKAEPVGKIEKGDIVIWINHRGDRSFATMEALTNPDFNEHNNRFPVEDLDLTFIPFARYDDEYFTNMGIQEAFPYSVKIESTLGNILAENEITQARVAESDKGKHVTYFFDGRKNITYPGEDAVIIPSEEVADKDKKPEMKFAETAQAVIEFVKGINGREKKKVIVVNFALDIQGHELKGDKKRGIQAVLATDKAVGEVLKAVKEEGGVAIVTADHGNVEEMAVLNKQGRPLKDKYGVIPSAQHAYDNPVPFIVNGLGKVELKEGGTLANITPTILEILGLPKPPEMDESLLVDYEYKEISGPVVLIIRDGWGISKWDNPEANEWNAVKLANPPVDRKLMENNPRTLLKAYGDAVGLPEYQMGDSDNGHTTMGAGKAYDTLYEQIIEQIDNGEFFQNTVLLDAFEKAKQEKRNIHIMGLTSSGGVHSDYRYLSALLEMAERNNLDSAEIKINLWPILDGRDVQTRIPDQSGQHYLGQIQNKIKELGLNNAQIAGIIGRYYTMDRDAINRDHKGQYEESRSLWQERFNPAYRLWVYGEGILALGSSAVIEPLFTKGNLNLVGIQARKTGLSSGHPTVEAEFVLESRDGQKITITGAAASGASAGNREAIFLFDKSFAKRAEKNPELLPDEMIKDIYGEGVDRKEALKRLKTNYQGKGVEIALWIASNILIPELTKAIKDGKVDPSERYSIDRFMREYEKTHGGDERRKLKLTGANTTAFSSAAAKLGAELNGIETWEFLSYRKDANSLKIDPDQYELVYPLAVLIEGGEHGRWNTDWQENMIRMRGDNFDEMVTKLVNITLALEDILIERGDKAGVGLESGYLPTVKTNTEPIELIIQAGKRAGYEPGKDFSIGLDLAASEFYRDYEGKNYYWYHVEGRHNRRVVLSDGRQLGRLRYVEENGKKTRYLLLTTDEQYEWLLDVLKNPNYYISSIEDVFDQDDFRGNRMLSKKLQDKDFIANLPHKFQRQEGIAHVGDDISTSNMDVIKAGILGETIVLGTGEDAERLEFKENTIDDVLLKLNQAGTVMEVMELVEYLRERGRTICHSHRGKEPSKETIRADVALASTTYPYQLHDRKGVKPTVQIKYATYRKERTIVYDYLSQAYRRIEEIKEQRGVSRYAGTISIEEAEKRWMKLALEGDPVAAERLAKEIAGATNVPKFASEQPELKAEDVEPFAGISAGDLEQIIQAREIVKHNGQVYVHLRVFFDENGNLKVPGFKKAFDNLNAVGAPVAIVVPKFPRDAKVPPAVAKMVRTLFKLKIPFVTESEAKTEIANGENIAAIDAVDDKTLDSWHRGVPPERKTILAEPKQGEIITPFVPIVYWLRILSGVRISDGRFTKIFEEWLIEKYRGKIAVQGIGKMMDALKEGKEFPAAEATTEFLGDWQDVLRAEAWEVM